MCQQQTSGMHKLVSDLFLPSRHPHRQPVSTTALTTLCTGRPAQAPSAAPPLSPGRPRRSTAHSHILIPGSEGTIRGSPAAPPSTTALPTPNAHLLLLSCLGLLELAGFLDNLPSFPRLILQSTPADSSFILCPVLHLSTANHPPFPPWTQLSSSPPPHWQSSPSPRASRLRPHPLHRPDSTLAAPARSRSPRARIGFAMSGRSTPWRTPQ